MLFYKDPAAAVPFDNETNGFTATDVQAAIEEAKLTGGVARYAVPLIYNGTVGDNAWITYSNNRKNSTPIAPPNPISKTLKRPKLFLLNPKSYNILFTFHVGLQMKRLFHTTRIEFLKELMIEYIRELHPLEYKNKNNEDQVKEKNMLIMKVR